MTRISGAVAVHSRRVEDSGDSPARTNALCAATVKTNKG